MNGARNFARGHVRAAFRFERACVAVLFSGEVEERAGFGQVIAPLGEVAMVLLQLLAARADIDVGFLIVGEVAARERPVRAIRCSSWYLI
jgi:hypothetical protein